MEKLFLKTDDGLIEIDPKQVEKYHLTIGVQSPFSRDMIVGKDGFVPDNNNPMMRGPKSKTNGELISEDGTKIDNGVTLAKSEVIDIGQGVDSSNK
jgi:hypothetical protein